MVIFNPGFFVYPEQAEAVVANGAPAIAVLGQFDHTSADGSFVPSFDKGGVNAGPTPFGLSINYGLTIDTTGHHLFTADYSNNRVLVFDLDSNNELVDRIADHVLGQSDMYSSTAAVTQSGMTGPWGLDFDQANSRLFVTEADNHRVLVFDLSSGITNGMNASYVLGQSNFTSSAGDTTQSKIWWPTDAEWDAANSRLFVTDNGNSRVMVYDLSSGITNGMNASYVLGQSTWTAWSSGTTSSKMYWPNDTEWDSANSRLFVADYWNHRVIVFDLSATIANGMAASYVLGQADFITRANATTSTGMYAPEGVSYDSGGSRLFVADGYNHRVLIYDVATIADGEAAVNVLGQADFTSSDYAATSTGLYYPNNVVWNSGDSYLYVADYGHNRIMVFDLAAVTDGEAAIDVVGQPATISNAFPPVASGYSFTKSGSNGGPFQFASFLYPKDTAFDSSGKRLFVSDGNGRILVFNTDSYGQPLDYAVDNVLGQSSFSGNSWVTTSTGTSDPRGIAWDATNSRLFLADTGNHRVLVYDLSSGITNGMSASYVLGQANFTSSSSAATSTGMNGPRDVAWDATNSKLFVCEFGNHRVTVFDLSSGITNGMAASNVLGQANFTSSGYSTTSTGMRYPNGVEWDATNSRLFVADQNNNRVTVFDLATIADGEPAVNVLGQAVFTTRTAATTSTGMSSPYETAWDAANSRLFVSDYGNNRVTVFDLATIANGEAAVNVFGQALFTTATAGTSSTGMNQPMGVNYFSSADRIMVTEFGNNRVLTFDAATAAGTLVATRDNKVTLSRLAAGASATFNLSFTLSHTLSSTLTVTFPAGFTVTAAATTASSSSCLSDFSYTSNTLTANKTLCGGPITLGGATVTLPSTPGSYTITWVNDDPGSATVIIVGNDQISITAAVAPTVSFLAVAQPAASTCANTSDLTGSDYTLALGTLNVATITESESLNADSDTVERICTQGSTNATSGMAVTVKNANGSSGLVSSSVPADTIPSSASGQLAAGTPGYGVCVRGSTLASDSGLTPAGIDPTATGDFSTYECESASGNIVALSGAAQGLWSASGPTQDATAAVWVRVAISAVQPAHNDYADSLTFVATATY